MNNRTIADIQSWLHTCNQLSEQELEELEHDGRSGVRKALLSWRNARQREHNEQQRVSHLWSYERQLFARGVQWVAGVDEVGRGPLAGPVTACAMILPPELFVAGINDSKKCSPHKREQLCAQLCDQAVAVAIAHVEPSKIDEINILQASLLAMKRALGALKVQPQAVLIDGNQRIPGLGIQQLPLVGGDGRSISIAAASIVAKVNRDRLMGELDHTYPQYQLAVNKGYPTPEHLESLRRYGASPIHRRSFAPVAAVCERSPQ